MSRRVSIPHVAALDGLRGAAVAGVLVFHGGHLTGGYLGVDLFFVLSGFLITSLLLAESGSSGHIALGGFWARRARRLLPAVAGMLVGVAVYCLVFASPADFAQIRGDALATLGYVANWRSVFANQDYWALFQAPSPLQHTWSLAIEEQFYLVWPLVFVGLLVWWKRSAPAAVLVTAAVGALLATMLMAVLYNADNVSRVYYGTDTRAAAILVGAAFAAALVVWGPVRGRVGRVILEGVGLAGVVFLAVAWTLVSGQSSFLYRGGFLLCGVAGVAVIAAAVHPRLGPVSRAFSFRPLCVLGLISYGVYLWHWPVYVVVDQARTGLAGWSLLVLRIAITLAIAAVSYRFLEMPIRRGAWGPREWRFVVPAAAAGLVLAIMVTTAGAKPRISAAEAAPASLDAALGRAAAAPAGSRKVMVVGNSVGWFLGRELDDPHARPPVVGFNAALPACVFPSGITRFRSSAGGNTVVSKPTTGCDGTWAPDVAQFRPDVVLLVASTATGELEYRSRWTRACDATYARMFRRDLRDTVATLGAHGAKVVITTSAYSRYLFGDPRNDREVDCDNTLRRQVARAAGAQLVDLATYTCPGGKCRAEVNGVKLRPDGLHYEDASARIVNRWILAQLDARRG